MRVYVAGSMREIDAVRVIQEMVRYYGHEITFDWTGPEGEVRVGGDWDAYPERGSEIACKEIAACRSAGLTVCLCPDGGLGCWIEVGATLCAGGLVWLIGSKRDSVFWQHPNVRRFATVDEFAASLSAREYQGVLGTKERT